MASVTISGSAIQGQTLTVNSTGEDLYPVYQWFGNGVYLGDTYLYASSYFLTQADVGKTISVSQLEYSVTYDGPYQIPNPHMGQVYSEATLPIANINDEPMGNVVINGSAKQGQILTVTNTLDDLDGLGVISYQWQANGINITTGNTYTLTQTDVGKLITSVASYTDEFGKAESVSSVATSVVENVNDTPTGSVTISGTVKQGQLLTASNTLVDVDGLGTVTYQWQADGVNIGTGDSYKVAAVDAGKMLTVIASYTDQSGSPERVSSSPTVPVELINEPPIGYVNISGFVIQGQTLTASNSLTDANGLGAITYQWQANGINVGAGTTYTLTATDVGKTIAAVANYTDQGSFSESVSSTATSLVTGSIFKPKTDFSVLDTYPMSVASGDVNGDGNIDLVTANSLGKVSLLFGQGYGNFIAQSLITMGSGSRSVLLTDVNADGKLDLVTANASVNSISVRLNNGTGVFLTKTDFATGTGVWKVVAGDFNGDNKIDLATINNSANTVSVFLGNGAGGFSTKTDFSVGTAPRGLAIADVNADGKLDLITANYSVNTVSVLLGNGNGSFSGKTDFTVGTGPRAVAIADVNKDGKLDLATTNGTDNTLSILFGTGDGTFSSKEDHTVGKTPTDLVFTDVDHDSDSDLVVSNSGDTTISIMLNSGSGNFEGPINYTTGASPSGLAIMDANSDNQPDVATANFSTNNISVLLNSLVPLNSLPSGISKTGTSGADTLTGGDGNDTLDGGLGIDIMIGGNGSDAYFVRDIGDVVTETNATTSTGGADWVNSYLLTYTLGPNVENGRILTTSGASLTGNGLNNTLSASGGVDVIDGGAGLDTLSYNFATTRDTNGIVLNLSVVNALGQSTASGISGADLIKGIENLYGSNYADTLRGNIGNNTINGSTGNDNLNGDAGNDNLNGSIGNDILTGGVGKDNFVFNSTPDAATNKDTLTDFNVVDDTIKLSKAVFTALGTANALLASSAFYSGAGVIAAHDSDDRVIYNTSNGGLYYDSDGNGVAASMQIATIQNLSMVTNADIWVVA